jgi:hypothetical protein
MGIEPRLLGPANRSLATAARALSVFVLPHTTSLEAFLALCEAHICVCSLFLHIFPALDDAYENVHHKLYALRRFTFVSEYG